MPSAVVGERALPDLPLDASRRAAGATRRRAGAVLELSVAYHGGRKHLPVVALRRVA